MAQVGDKVIAKFQTRTGEVEVPGRIVCFWNGGVEVTFDREIEYGPGLMRDGAWYPAAKRSMVRAA